MSLLPRLGLKPPPSAKPTMHIPQVVPPAAVEVLQQAVDRLIKDVGAGPNVEAALIARFKPFLENTEIQAGFAEAINIALERADEEIGQYKVQKMAIDDTPTCFSLIPLKAVKSVLLRHALPLEEIGVSGSAVRSDVTQLLFAEANHIARGGTAGTVVPVDLLAQWIHAMDLDHDKITKWLFSAGFKEPEQASRIATTLIGSS